MIKTNLGLVEYVKSKLGTPYVYGTKMEVLTKEKYDWLKKTYGKTYVWNSDASKIGKICCDCSGLICAYTGKEQGSSQMKDSAKTCRVISTIKSAPIGAILWRKGHVGVYIGMENGFPYYIAEDGSAFGCRKNKLAYSSFSHWLTLDSITYVEEKNQLTKLNITKENISKLTELGVIASPLYWSNVSLTYLNELCFKAISVLDKDTQRGITDIKEALKVLVDNNIIKSQQYWEDKVNDKIKGVKYLDILIINIANKVKY